MQDSFTYCHYMYSLKLYYLSLVHIHKYTLWLPLEWAPSDRNHVEINPHNDINFLIVHVHS